MQVATYGRCCFADLAAREFPLVPGPEHAYSYRSCAPCPHLSFITVSTRIGFRAA